MNLDEIYKLQAELDTLCHKAYEENSYDDSWVAFRAVHNKSKSVINKSKRVFVINAHPPP